MSKKNIVSIEERIPKLKQARKKKANRRLIFYLSIFFFLISIIVYLQSPLSHIRSFSIEGNIHTSEEEIIDLSQLTTDQNIWMIDIEHTEKLIQSNPIIDTVEVTKEWPWTVNMNITEHNVVGYVKKERNYIPVLSNGVTINQLGQPTYNGNSPMLIGFSKDDYLIQMAKELNALPESVANLISEIHWQPTEDNKNKILLYMNDGYIVDGTIRNFADKMEVYPSIVSQLEPGSKGIIHIGVGVYFESFDSEETEDDGLEELPGEID
ncbi:cell division protein FtsQ/DivIB [Oceanobacillus senegalensis]|uniref:cell division protein FtsQ/DivIB n=1 Tax=Oceanobacillus senegalensis TaxID=1936063 RepID=UPI000A311801|nr:cell division protein FtsQ/DivIB [Oceanobacillus senegalensis]